MRKSRRTSRTSKKRKGQSSAHRKLLPVLRPSQNMRDIIKQLVMLEDHLYQPQKRCTDCIRKHFLTIEALAEECATLCKPKAILPEARTIATKVRILHHVWEARRKDSALMETVASKLRKLRKGLMRTFSALPLNKLPSKETSAVNAVLQATKKSRRRSKRKPRRAGHRRKSVKSVKSSLKSTLTAVRPLTH